MSLITHFLYAVTPIAHAANGTLDTTPIKNLITSLTSIVDMLVPVIFALAFLVFLFGVFQYFIAGAADEEKRKTGRTFVLWAVIGFVIMISIWGLVKLATTTLGLDGSTTRPDLPTFGATK